MSILSRSSRSLSQAVRLSPRRYGSTHAHDSQAEGHEYPTEGFSGPFWRNAVLCSLLAVGAYKLAPEASEDAYLTRWIQLYTAPRDLWTERAAKHTSMSLESSETELIFSDAQRPPVHRYRYPQTFEQVSPFLTPVESSKDTTPVKVQAEK